MTVKRLKVKARLSVSNPSAEITYGNFTSRGQPHAPRARDSWLRDGISGMIPFSGKCFRMWREAVSAYSPRDLCVRVYCMYHVREEEEEEVEEKAVYEADGCVGAITGWNVMLWAFSAHLCQCYAWCSQYQCEKPLRQPPEFRSTENNFSRRVEASRKTMRIFISFFNSPNFWRVSRGFSN